MIIAEISATSAATSHFGSRATHAGLLLTRCPHPLLDPLVCPISLHACRLPLPKPRKRMLQTHVYCGANTVAFRPLPRVRFHATSSPEQFMSILRPCPAHSPLWAALSHVAVGILVMLMFNRSCLLLLFSPLRLEVLGRFRWFGLSPSCT